MKRNNSINRIRITQIILSFFNSSLYLIIFRIYSNSVFALGKVSDKNRIQVPFQSYNVAPARTYSGRLAPNSILNHAHILQVSEEIPGPESIAIRGGDELFMGDKTRRIVGVGIKDGKVRTVAILGFPCDNIIRKSCSWPLGMRFDPNGKLVFTDMFGGLLKIDVDTGAVDQYVTRFQDIDGAPVGFPQDLDIAKDGTIYWSDSSTSSTVETAYNEFLGRPSGRLLKYDPSKNESTVLLRNIHFANGVQLSKDEDFVLISELAQYRVIRYYLKGDKNGHSDIFIDGLPGTPDNIRSNGKGGFYLSLFSLNRPFISVDTNPNLKKLISQTMNILNYVTSGLYYLFPNAITNFLYTSYLSALEVRAQKPLRACIIELNENGEIVGSLQSTNIGHIYGISQMTIDDSRSNSNAYFVSPSSSKIWYINRYYLP